MEEEYWEYIDFWDKEEEKLKDDCSDGNISKKEDDSYIRVVDCCRKDDREGTATLSGRYLCEQCPKSFSTWTVLNRHQMYAHDDGDGGKFICGRCHYRAKEKSNMVRHMRIHLGLKPFQCQQCTSAFISSDKLDRHVRARHTTERPFPCDVCKKAFVTKDALGAHRWTHDTQRVKFGCSICNVHFTRKWDVKNHERKHSSP